MDKTQLEEGLELAVQYEKRGGLVPTIVQDADSGDVLMLGYANQQALKETLRSGYATFWSTSRNELWTKGDTSGDFLKIREILVDCDQDALIYRVERCGNGACHTKDRNCKARKSCFYRRLIDGSTLEFIAEETLLNQQELNNIKREVK